MPDVNEIIKRLRLRAWEAGALPRRLVVDLPDAVAAVREAAQPDAEKPTPRSELRRIAAVEGVCPICAARPVPAPDNPQRWDASNCVRLCDRCEGEYGITAGADVGDDACATCGNENAPHIYPHPGFAAGCAADQHLRDALLSDECIEFVAPTTTFRGGPCACGECQEAREDTRHMLERAVEWLAASSRDTPTSEDTPDA